MKMCLLMRAVLPTDSSCMALGGPFQTVRFEPFLRFGKLSYLFDNFSPFIFSLGCLASQIDSLSISFGLTFWEIGSPFSSRPYSQYYILAITVLISKNLFSLIMPFPHHLVWVYRSKSTSSWIALRSQIRIILEFPEFAPFPWGLVVLISYLEFSTS